MASIMSNLAMYSLTVQPPTAITQVVVGNFAGGGSYQQFVLTACGPHLNLYEQRRADATINLKLSHNTFGIIRAMAPFRVPGTSKDHIALVSDAGRLTILEYLSKENRFNRVHLETFGKSGVRRTIPGQYLCMDARGRCCLIASVEKNRLVYVVNRDSRERITISTPHEALTPNTLIFDACAVDMGWENAMFATLECRSRLVNGRDDEEEENPPPPFDPHDTENQMMLAYYEFDAGVNHIVKRWSDRVDPTSHKVFQVPGGPDGPSGVLVCSDEVITYHHNNQTPHRVLIPRRVAKGEDLHRKRKIVAGVTHRIKSAFFILVQTDDGDLFKISLIVSPDSREKVQQMTLQHFATIPVAVSLAILKSGALFAALESGDNHLYRFDNLGRDHPTSYSIEFEAPSKRGLNDQAPPYEPEFFRPRDIPDLIDSPLYLHQQFESSNPTTASEIADLTDDEVPQIYSVCGRGPRSTFRMKRHGLEALSDVAEPAQLPSPAIGIYTGKTDHEAETDKYIIISFKTSSLVLEMKDGDAKVPENTLFETDTPTLGLQLLATGWLVQVHTHGLRCIKGSTKRDWPPPRHRTILATATNTRQVVLALSSGEIVCFETDEQGALGEYEERPEMPATVRCLSVAEIPEGRKRCPFIAVGCDDSTVRILSAEPHDALKSLSVQALSAPPSAIQIMPLMDPAYDREVLFLHIGLQSGVYIRVVMDEKTGTLGDTTLRFLGVKPITFTTVDAQGSRTLLALSSRTWVVYNDPRTGEIKLTPLIFNTLTFASRFVTRNKQGHVDSGFACTTTESLMSVAYIPSLTSDIDSTATSLAYTPRDLSRHPHYPLFAVVQADINVPPLTGERPVEVQISDYDASTYQDCLDPNKYGRPCVPGKWASCIQLVEPFRNRVVNTTGITDGEAATVCTWAPIESQDGEYFLFVGTGASMQPLSGESLGGCIHLYRLHYMQLPDAPEPSVYLELLHKTLMQYPPRAMIPYKGRVLAGVGRELVIFDVGLRQLLRKTVCRNCTDTVITAVSATGSHITVSDARESVTYVKYSQEENTLLRFADDVIARYVTCMQMVDYDMVAAGDRFGNVFLLRCPDDASKDADSEGAYALLKTQRGYLSGAANKLQLLSHFYVQDIPIGIHKTPLVPGGQDVILWTGLQGTIGILAPLSSRLDVEFFHKLEGHVRSVDDPLLGRDHLMYRSYYVGVKGCIDGDLCERFLALPKNKKAEIAGLMETTVRQITKKLNTARARAAF